MAFGWGQGGGWGGGAGKLASFDTLLLFSDVHTSACFVNVPQLKEGKRLREFLEDYDDERDDPKFYR